VQLAVELGSNPVEEIASWCQHNSHAPASGAVAGLGSRAARNQASLEMRSGSKRAGIALHVSGTGLVWHEEHPRTAPRRESQRGALDIGA
jgi:hypothetical protein